MVNKLYHGRSIEEIVRSLKLIRIDRGYSKDRILFKDGEINLSVTNGIFEAYSTTYLPNGKIINTYSISKRKIKENISPRTFLNLMESEIIQRYISLKGIPAKENSASWVKKEIIPQQSNMKDLESVFGLDLEKVGVMS